MQIVTILLQKELICNTAEKSIKNDEHIVNYPDGFYMKNYSSFSCSRIRGKISDTELEIIIIH